MTQIFTILWDSYKLLAAKKLFWITLGLTILIALLYASVGFYDGGISLFFGAAKLDNDLINVQSDLASHFYMKIFTNYLVPWWLGLFSIVLALISVTPVFPNFFEKGAIDVAVSKPIRRTTLFLTKYMGCLLFVAAQVALFCVICYVAQGVRIQQWSLQIFWAIPLLLLAFSSIFCIAVLTAVVTRSTVFSLLMALLIWGLGVVLNSAEKGAYNYAYNPMMEIARSTEQGGIRPKEVHTITQRISMPTPKVTRLTNLLKEKVKIDGKEVGSYLDAFLSAFGFGEKQSEFKLQSGKRHSMAYIFGSTSAFNIIVLGLACFLFERKDF